MAEAARQAAAMARSMENELTRHLGIVDQPSNSGASQPATPADIDGVRSREDRPIFLCIDVMKPGAPQPGRVYAAVYLIVARVLLCASAVYLTVAGISAYGCPTHGYSAHAGAQPSAHGVRHQQEFQ